MRHKFNYEIVARGTEEHRHGHLTLLIDGVESEKTCDPSQFLPKSMRQAEAEFKEANKPLDPAQLAIRAEEICQDYAARSIERMIDRLQRGSLFAGGIPIGANGLADGVKLRDKRPRRGTEVQAVETFLNRGHLRGLTKEDRAKRRARRNEKRDHYADWLERRGKLIAKREAELKEAEEKALKNPKFLRDVEFLKGELAALKGSGVFAASHGFQYAYGRYLTKNVDMVNDDVRFIHLMTNTTVDTERDAKDSISDFTTLDNFDGSGTSANGHALDSQAVNIDDANDRAEFDAADETITALGAGTRSIQGLLVFSWITDLNSSLPLHWIEYAANKTPDGSDFVVTFNAEGIIQAADG